MVGTHRRSWGPPHRRHKTSMGHELYKSNPRPLPWDRAAAKASLFARLHSCGHLRHRVPEDRLGLLPATTGLEEESDTKCPNQRVP